MSKPDSAWSNNISTISHGAGIALTGLVLGTFFRYLFQILLTRNLGAELFGLFFLGFSIFKVASVLSEIGLSYGVVRYVSIYEGEDDKPRLKGTIYLALKLGLTASLICGTLIFLFSGLIASSLFQKPELTPVLKYFSVILPFFTLTTIFLFAAQGLKIIQAKTLIRDIIEPILRIGLTALLFWAGLELSGVLTAFMFASLAAMVLSFLYLTQLFPGFLHPAVIPREEKKSFFHYSWPLVLVQFMAVLLMWTDSIMLGIFRTSAEVGIYGAAQRTALLTSLIVTAFHSIFTPVIADLFNKNIVNAVRPIFKTVSKLSFSLTLPFGLLIFIFSDFFLGLFGPGFSAGSTALKILTVGWVTHALLGLSSSILTMSGRSRLHLFNTGLFFAVNIVLNLWLIPLYGAAGAALATTSSIILLDVLVLLEVRSLLHLHPFTAGLLKSLASGTAVFFAIRLIALTAWPINQFINTIISAAAMIIVYFTGLYILGLEQDEKELLKTFRERLVRSFKNGSRSHEK